MVRNVRLAWGIFLVGLWLGGGLATPTARGGKDAVELSDADKQVLFQVARDSIRARLKGQSAPLPSAVSPLLKEPRGVFVTLEKQGRLRGCIGYIEAVKPLLSAVQEMAEAAAFHDPRFPPVREEELAELEIEISILSPIRRIDHIDEIQVGKHGLIMERGGARGLLLPQVATEYKWDRLTFLQQTCIKAGLPPDAWKDPATRIYVFSADILHEPKSRARSNK